MLEMRTDISNVRAPESRECSCSDDCDDFETPRIRQLVKTEYYAYAIMPAILNNMLYGLARTCVNKTVGRLGWLICTSGHTHT